MRMESPLNQRLRRSPPDVVYTPIDVTSGDTVAEAAAAPAEEQDTNKETDQEPRGSDDATGEAAGDETAAPNELKVVVSVKDGRATIGVQQPSSDPHIESFDDSDLS